MKDDGFETFIVHSFLCNGDSNEHRILKKNFQTQHALNNDQHPKKVMRVSDAFQSHTWDQAHMKKKKQREAPKQNKDIDQDKESGTLPMQ